MNRAKQILSSLPGKKYSAILFLLIIVSILHFSTITNPYELIFDEKYYVPAAQSILNGEGSDRIEHPPLGQLIISSGMFLFGDNPFGWRVFSVIFGIAGILIFYLIILRLPLNPKYAFFAAFIFGFENLSFTQASIAMLDVFCLTFMLFGFLFYMRGNCVLSGIFVGLAALTKLTGILILPLILTYWILTDRHNIKHPILISISSVFTFGAMLPIFDFLIWHEWLNPISQIKNMLYANSLATFASYPSEMLSRPWDWILHPEILTYWANPHYIAMISPTLWVLILPAILFAFYKSIKGNRAAIFAVVWFTWTYLIWIFASLITDRLSYIYYFYPAICAICTAISLASESLTNVLNSPSLSVIIRKSITYLISIVILLHLGAFVILSPITYWWKLPFSVITYFLVNYYFYAYPAITKTSEQPVQS